MYERNGEKYFVVDGHVHFWDVASVNWMKGQQHWMARRARTSLEVHRGICRSVLQFRHGLAGDPDEVRR